MVVLSRFVLVLLLVVGPRVQGQSEHHRQVLLAETNNDGARNLPGGVLESTSVDQEDPNEKASFSLRKQEQPPPRLAKETTKKTHESSSSRMSRRKKKKQKKIHKKDTKNKSTKSDHGKKEHPKSPHSQDEDEDDEEIGISCPIDDDDDMPWKISSKHYKKGKKEGKHKKKKHQSSCSFDSLVVFGDSLSDTGTGLLEFPCNDPSTGIPCLQRTTDGRVFVEYLADLVVPSLNPGGLTIGDPGFEVPDDSPVSLVPGGSNFAQRAAYARNPVQDPRDPSLAT